MNFELIKEQNIRKTWMIIFVFSGIIIALGWYLSNLFQNNIILYGSVAFSLVSTWISYFFSDRMAISSSGSKKIDLNTKEGLKLEKIIRRLTNNAGLPMPKLYIMVDPAINAFATGRNPEHASVSVTTGALEKLDENELSGVLAHELTHIKNRDILVMTIVVSLAGILTFFMRVLTGGSGTQKKSPLSGIFAIVLALLAPIAVMLIRASVSRKREYMADAGGAIITNNPKGLADALEKIKMYSQPMRKRSLNTAHLFISSPYRADIAGIKLGFFEKLFADHPPLDERIAILRGERAGTS